MQESFIDDQEEELEMPDELTALKARADLMGMSYHPSIGVDKLRAKIDAALEEEQEEALKPKTVEKESENEVRARKRREASELIRIRVTCMNPNKKEWDGEIFTAGNSLVGTFKKYVPFNSDEGWHVPRIIYNQLVQRQCQVFTNTKDSRGNTTRKGKMIKEFSIEIMPTLTPEELSELARRQAMAKSVD